VTGLSENVTSDELAEAFAGGVESLHWSRKRRHLGPTPAAIRRANAALAQVLSFARARALSLSPALTRSLSLARSRAPSLSRALALSLPPSLPLSLPPSLPLSLSRSLSQALGNASQAQCVNKTAMKAGFFVIKAFRLP
jgi:hypothetical protein